MYALDLLDPSEKEDVELLVSMFPALKTELNAIQSSLEKYAISQGVLPAGNTKRKISDSISNLQKEQNMDLNDLPLITRFSDHNKWLKALEGQIPVLSEDKGRVVRVLQKTDKLIQMLIVSSTDFEDEVHEDLDESFLILSGQCQCTVGDNVRFMEAGEFMAIPLHKHHDVQILSGTVTAILQRVSL